MMHLPLFGRASIRAAAAFSVFSSLALAGAAYAEPQDCFDAKVDAVVTEQIPSVIPETDDDSVVMRWPWFLDLKIKQVLAGKVAKGTMTVLAMQHTYIAPAYRSIWWLRHNSAGGFNTLDFPQEAQLNLCPANTDPMAAYIRPNKGHTLEESRQAGEQRYGRHP